MKQVLVIETETIVNMYPKTTRCNNRKMLMLSVNSDDGMRMIF